jgi:hypothetical protein
MKTFSHLWQYLAEFFLAWEMIQIRHIEKFKSNILFSKTFPPPPPPKTEPFVRLSKSMVEPKRPQMAIWRPLRAGLIRLHALKHTSAPVHPHPHRYKRTRTHTHRGICKTYCFSTEIMVSWTHLHVTLHVYCLSCNILELLQEYLFKPRCLENFLVLSDVSQ